MNDTIHNSGFMATGNSTVTIGQLATGRHARITNTGPAPSLPRSATRPRGIGLVTFKSTEMRAAIDVLWLTRERGAPNGQDLYTGTVDAADGTTTIVAAHTLQQGQRSIIPTLGHLREHSNPGLFIVLGVGGAIRRSLVIGDVVVATRIIYYDLRRETRHGVRHRGEERHAPAAITHAVNSFFTDHDEPAHLDSPTGRFRVLPGPIGSGDAVVTDAESEIRKFLLAYNEHTLAVEMEAAGLTQYCHEAAPPAPGWFVVRGISDLADHAKTESHQSSAAHNAATALRHLIPYLPTRV